MKTGKSTEEQVTHDIAWSLKFHIEKEKAESMSFSFKLKMRQHLIDVGEYKGDIRKRTIDDILDMLWTVRYQGKKVLEYKYLQSLIDRYGESKQIEGATQSSDRMEQE